MKTARKLVDRDNLETKVRIAAAVEKCEREDGHLMSGGIGVSAFLRIVVDEERRSVSYSVYGNGVSLEHVEEELESTVPGFMYMCSTLD
ncbi:MAG: hypothetical protein NTY16_06600 [Deltaproteobacteria bacterium]|nr:hypothetical protein [Deltaproteobacteria bacterium]